MRVPRRIMPKGTQTFDTYLELPITVTYEMNAPEPDVGYAGGLEIVGVYQDGCLLNLTDSQLNDLAGEIEESHTSAYEAACDSAMDAAREERYED
jgi:hypothetical protein